ncbi:MAG: serine/threonine-protein kinase [Candidatus Sulfopaludibacter sp.]|nr:serine/threonine-protein kinase [Candidatus Sulfopaludibacter sp.]
MTFGRYTVIGQLGKGAMGVVYLAEDPALNRQVAIKTVELTADDPQQCEFLRTRLLRDARAAAILKHPNIVAVHDIFEDGTRACVVMEYVEGASLAAQLQANPLPGPELTLKVLSQMAAALDYTHAHGIIHRDIKPANVMIDTAGTARIMDFGIARIADTRTSTPTGMVMGTVEYMAPEQIRGEPLDGRADQFALGVVAYQMMTGSTLFGPQTLATLTYKIVNEMPPSPCARNAALPRSVDAVLARALAKAPSGRFVTCSEFVAALAQAFSDTPSTRLTTAPPPRRSRVPVLAAVAAVLALGAALAVWRPWNRPPQTPQPVAAALPPGRPVVAPPVAPPTARPAGRPVKKAPPPVAAKPAETPPEPMEETELPPPPPPEPKTGAILTPFDVVMKAGQEQLRNKDFAGALQSFTKAAALRPNGPFAHFNLGVAQQNLQQNEAAVRSYSQVIRLEPDNALAYAERGVCQVRLRRDDDALIDFQRALEIKPGLPIALNGRGGVAFRRKQYRLALADYDAAIKGNPNLAPAYANRAKAREAVGDLRGAAEDRQREALLRTR